VRTDQRISQGPAAPWARIALAAAGALLLAGPAAAQQRPDSSGIHVVRSGATLWDIARSYLGDPFLWRDLYQVNRGTVADPHWIYPRERLRIPGREAAAGSEMALADAPLALPDRTVFYGERGPAAAGFTLADEVERRRAPVTEGDFYRASVLALDEEIVPVGEVADLRHATVVPMLTVPQIQPYDRIFVRVVGSGTQAGAPVHFYRPEGAVATLGRIYRSTGLGTVESVSQGVATVVVERLFDQVKVGDLVLPAESYVAPTARQAPPPGAGGRVVAMLSPHPLAHLHDEAFVDLGGDAGVRPGDELVAYQPSRQESWGVRPEVEVARLRVVRVTPRSATVRVIGIEQPALEAGLPVRRAADGS
jgi:hypothetical protein